jgi:hypothetical protein
LAKDQELGIHVQGNYKRDNKGAVTVSERSRKGKATVTFKSHQGGGCMLTQ